MKRILTALLLVIATTSLLAVTTPAEARRLGGGSSLGMKRAAPAPAPAAPAAAPAAPTQAAAPAGANTAPAPAATPPASSGFSKWLGPLAGLGIGAGLMAMFNGGLGAGMGSMFAMLALAAVAFFLFQMFRRKSQGATAPAMHYADVTPLGAPRLSPTVNPVADFPVSAGPLAGSSAAVVEKPRYPQGFDAEEFVRQAKISFIRLQAANDGKDLRDIRDFTTPELYAELAMQIQERGNAAQRTEVVKLDAELLEAVAEQERIIASVRYSGLIREEAAGDALPFSETWHVVKDLQHPTPTWHIAGIQQNG